MKPIGSSRYHANSQTSSSWGSSRRSDVPVRDTTCAHPPLEGGGSTFAASALARCKCRGGVTSPPVRVFGFHPTPAPRTQPSLRRLHKLACVGAAADPPLPGEGGRTFLCKFSRCDCPARGACHGKLQALALITVQRYQSYWDTRLELELGHRPPGRAHGRDVVEQASVAGGSPMKRNTTRIRTSHVGRLPPPKGFEDMPARLA